ncbi:GlsB/YeaQ/YmgE family stress response membrane protein [Pseudomonas sp. CAU 1711]|uniref:GlsB/YeaQ/YmgE family stress response membrane protein n=1 Tax=Pseudomonas sp. CAU 1711 TaxID=3140356 RepID=UPI0032605802
MSLIATLFFGLLVVRFIKSGADGMGWSMTIVLGIGGSIAATYGGQALGIYQAEQAAGFVGAVAGAVCPMAR